jgi:transcription elongation GreA/GreB family factor
VREKASGKDETYTILGAWDGDPDRHIISYQTAIGQALLGHKAGETVNVSGDHTSASFEIISIEAAPVDQAEPDQSLSEIETASV